jgi:hypothetical protein
MNVINCFYIIDVISLCELVYMSDIRGFDVKNFQNPMKLPQY